MGGTAPEKERNSNGPEENIRLLKKALEEAEAVVIGAGAGLSAAAGYTYAGERYRQYFSDFADHYGIPDMYTGGFYPFAEQTEYWAWWSRVILLNRYRDPPRPVYRNLLDLVREKDYFVITTNVDHCFQKAGFDKKRLFYTQGDYGLFQCSVPCCQRTYDNGDVVREMVARQEGMRIPAELIPCCPRCGEPMAMNLRVDDRFVEDEGWHLAADRYENFLKEHRRQKVLFWELGVGNNTPGIIKYPFWNFTMENPQAVYACVNHSSGRCPDLPRFLMLQGEIGGVLQALKEL